MKRITIFLFVLLLTQICYSQNVKNVTGAKGTYQIINITPEEAKVKALAQAKTEALKLAGVAEHIQSYDLLYKSEIGNKFEEVFISDLQSEIRGAVKSFTITSEKKILDLSENLFIEITIDAEVMLYEVGPDPAFKAKIDGIKAGYQNGEKMFYTITPTQNCYLNIFNLFEKNATLIFPNSYEKQQLFEAGKTYKFPLSEIIEGYELERTTKDSETNKLVFVFTKDNVPYINSELIDGDQITSFEEMSAWLFTISPDKRVNNFVSFVIY